jgi:CDI immunity protein
MNEVKKRACARALANDEFFCIETSSGHARMGRDPQGKQHLLTPDTSDDALGSALLDALAHSRFLKVEEIAAFFDYERCKQQYAEWVNTMMKRYGYKSRRALFKNMKNCGIECQDGQILISPTHYDKLEGWGREKDDGIVDVVIGADKSPQEIGAALRLAFGRCT